MSGSTVNTQGRSDALQKRLDPRSFIVRGISSLGRLIIPIAIGAYTILDDGEAWGLMIFVPIVAAVLGLNIVFAYLSWRKFTYQVGEADIRVESGIVSRAARSVPYERIQDVSLEQKFLPRLFGLTEVKFETGSGGGEDLKLSFLTEAEGEALRRLVRARREGDAASQGQAIEGEADLSVETDERGETLFAMDTRRLTTFGLFEFSLAVFAVLGGLAQYAETFMSIEIWDPDLWLGLAESQQGKLASLGFAAQIFSAVAGVVVLFVIGSATGLVRTFLRDWGFLLEKTARGFRRRRGLLTRTDVVMPIHRVQAIQIGTGWLRYRFGWHGLKFVSLAQDAGSSSHVVAPFAQMQELEPIIRAAGFGPPAEALDWHRASTKYRLDSILIESAIFIVVAAGVAVVVSPVFALIPLAIAAFSALANLYAWKFHRHALDPAQVLSTRGLLSPSTQICSRVKLHSAEIVQGPIAQRRGYATLHLGLAGGGFSIPGLPLERARSLRKAIMQSITAKDFSQLT